MARKSATSDVGRQPLHPLDRQVTDFLEDAIQYGNSFERLPWLLDAISALPKWGGLGALPRIAHFLGRHWSGFDNIGVHRHDIAKLVDLIVEFGLRDHMMDSAESEALAKLPRMITVYRGCSAVNMNGLSWSLSREVAEGFPKLNRYRPPQGQQPILITGRVSRGRVILKMDRGEQEIIANRVRRVSVESIGLC